ncbi:MAG: hypothetical protein PF689_05225 [Deltaproteobacteria bacterium]|jgi:pilus assembly protein Flp/PilA|nr:hypothetical protein [Deltaproteobacteria bacterium]
MQKLMNRLRRDTKGQGMTEYIIIVALIAIAAIGVVTLFGDNIRKLFGSSANALAGNTDVTTDAKEADSKHTDTKTLETFGMGNEGE